jgi:hypothetical protein
VRRAADEQAGADTYLYDLNHFHLREDAAAEEEEEDDPGRCEHRHKTKACAAVVSTQVYI